MSLWWVWMVAGLILAVAEMLLPGFVLLGFAIGAGMMGLGLLTGVLGGLTALAGSYGAALLLLIFAVLSLLAWLGLRAAFETPGVKPRLFDTDVND